MTVYTRVYETRNTDPTTNSAIGPNGNPQAVKILVEGQLINKVLFRDDEVDLFLSDGNVLQIRNPYANLYVDLLKKIK